ncbi:LysE family translocator [Salinisphaera hydrothermalis]|uniref:Lysine exporter protein n=1 Tax=Salinisphaera hydrothermalis (strain C41B8) TaxID=1304275 RepID=A0A084IPV7_SALHC|nr:LysE family translocator [Salinisphaera hydrothermalis]KEZ78741.1 lysine exporter protein [Salinisphaera hydrothermalis C41B8]
MPGLHEYLLFVAAGLLLNITPGADMLYVVTQAGRHGLARGVAGALGVFAGTLVHITLAIAGLSALLAASATAFALVKYVGAAYLVYLGLRLLFSRRAVAPTRAADAEPAPRPALSAVFRRGWLVNVLNPKIALFFLAFLPQFIDPAAGDRMLAFGVLGLTFNTTGTLVNCLAAWATVGIGRLPLARAAGRVAERVVGGLFVGLGCKLAFDSSA